MLIAAIRTLLCESGELLASMPRALEQKPGVNDLKKKQRSVTLLFWAVHWLWLRLFFSAWIFLFTLASVLRPLYAESTHALLRWTWLYLAPILFRSLLATHLALTPAIRLAQ